ncbi:MAG: hypothetical protein QOJ99_3796 [Bryobacterales bacterium]|jgi:hypothetical protein|nr:hypothetical protein [Bryobacterales bacterium]
MLLAQLAIMEGETYVYTGGEGSTYPGEGAPGRTPAGKNGFGFSTAEITRLAHRELRLQKAIQYKNQSQKRTTGHQGGPVRTPKAA